MFDITQKQYCGWVYAWRNALRFCALRMTVSMAGRAGKHAVRIPPCVANGLFVPGSNTLRFISVVCLSITCLPIAADPVTGYNLQPNKSYEQPKSANAFIWVRFKKMGRCPFFFGETFLENVFAAV
jgi:hypothetical protein